MSAPARAAARAIVTIKGTDGSVVATKTTTLKAISNLLKAERGEITVPGTEGAK